MDLTNDRRIQLAHKGKRLYKKYCGLGGKTTCADSFAEYHASLGEYEVVVDFLDFLRHTLMTESDLNKIDMTEQLIVRVEELLGDGE
jgi:hypothetical protein